MRLKYKGSDQFIAKIDMDALFLKDDMPFSHSSLKA